MISSMVRGFMNFDARSVLRIGVASALALTLVQCDLPEPGSPAPKSELEVGDPQNTLQSPSPAPAPASTTTLRRGAILNAAAQAASAYGREQIRSGPDPIVGRRFSVNIPFGCSGPAPENEARFDDGLPRWTWGRDRETIQISVAPQDWLRSGLIVGSDEESSDEDWEAAEGFWIPKPWTDAESCPPERSGELSSSSLARSSQTVGLVAIYEAGGSRVGRRNGRAYVVTLRRQGDEDLQAPADGFRLRIEGRVVGFPGGQAFRCSASGPDARPVCIAAIQLDEVRIEDAAGTPLSEWRAG